MCKDWKYFGDTLTLDNDVNNMYGWLRKLLGSSRVSSQCREAQQHEQVARVSKNSATNVSSVSTSLPLSSSSFTSSLKKPTKQPRPPAALSSPVRWRRKYDVFVCHSSVHIDIEEAIRLVSFLEASPCSLRCFLWQRDASPGAAISTELCEAVQNSHCRALLITPGFLEDGWCKYIMHQALAEGPMSNRMIPLIQNLSCSQYPQELRFYYYIDLSKNADHGYTLVNKSVLKYLTDMVENEKTLDCKMDSSCNRADAIDSSPGNTGILNDEPSLSLEVIEETEAKDLLPL